MITPSMWPFIHAHEPFETKLIGQQRIALFPTKTRPIWV